MKNRIMIAMGLMILFVTLIFVSKKAFLQSYLFSVLFFLNLSLGALAWRLVHRLTGGGWKDPISRHLDSSANNLPVFIFLFIPILIGVRTLYPWSGEVLKSHQAEWLTVRGFVFRSCIYLAAWIFLWKKQVGAGISLVVLLFTVTFAAIDWSLSFEHEWSSTAYGLVLLSSQGLAALAFCIFMEMRRNPEMTQKTFLDLGNLLFAATIFWSYLSFFQYLVIWMGSLPDEMSYFIRRSNSGWQWIALVLLIFQVGIPILLLLFRAVKQDPSRLRFVAALVLAMRLLDHFWTLVPGFQRASSLPSASDVLCYAALALVWLGCYGINLRSRPESRAV